jgi:type I restriction-modification system DNA methylase subunit
MKEELRLVQLTIRILDSPNYEHYSEGKANDYLNYFKDHRADEDRLIVPVLLSKFLEQILEFRLGETIGAQESGAEGKPDFIPIDNQTHPFVFDAKGSDTQDLSVHYGEKSKYLATHGFQYLILVNMRDLAVFVLDSPQPLKEYSFSFYKLYQDFQENPKDTLKKENTHRFFRFIARFQYCELSLEEKLERVKAAKPWTGEEELDVELLTRRLKHIVNVLYEDAKRERAELTDLPEFNPERARSIAQEVELIASEISPAHKLEEATEETLMRALEVSSPNLYGRAIDTFFYRVAYFTMTRLLLVRMWEDIGFIIQTLYDGGLDKWYEAFNHELEMVLKHAFDLAAKRYESLFTVPNNYSWYTPSNEALVNVLYELSNFNVGKLNRDVLGMIYEEYIDRVDKKRKGQYYTPREIVSFIWDRVGFNNPKAFFDYEKGKREPKPIFDPATGSGGFLVEAARRLREESQLDFNDRQNMNDLRRAIFYGLYGAEISPFPYYITEVNLLIQYTPVIKQLIPLRGARKKEHQKEHLPLAVVRVDSLSLYNNKDNPYLPTDVADEYKPDKLHDVLPLDSRKKLIYHKIKGELAGKFAYCCANPPYIGEKGHKGLFRSTLNRYLYWKQFYQGKMDYLYWFIILGLSKLREGGKLGFITTAYWPTADGAAKLRKFILENAKIKEMVFFENVKIFEHAKGQHNMVFVLEKRSSKEKSKERDENRIKIARVLAKDQDIPGERISEKLSFLTQHLSAHLDEDKYEDEYIKVFWSGTRQGELSDKRWNILHSSLLVRFAVLAKELRLARMP